MPRLPIIIPVLLIGLNGFSAACAQEPAVAPEPPVVEDGAAPASAGAGADDDSVIEDAPAAGGENAENASEPSEDPAADPSAEDMAAEGASPDADADEPAMTPTAPSRFQPIYDLIEAGGAVIVILAVLSILSLMVIVVKMVQFFGLAIGKHRFAEKVANRLKEGDETGALDLVSRQRGVVARVMETAVRGKMLGADDAAVKEEVERVAKAKLDGLERGLPLLSLIATVSPLLGLLGTVLGMIEAFQQLENAGDRVDPAILSGGIWEALLTTAAGLSVAIPAAAFYTWLQRSVDVAAQRMEDAAARVFTAKIYARPSASSDGD